MIRFHVLTLFPEMVEQGLGSGVIGRAAEKGIIALDAVNIRNYTLERHGKVDDYPYGGGAGMLMQAQPVYDAHRAVSGGRKIRTVYLTPQGTPFTQRMARTLAEEEELIFLCGHYEGIDERVLEEVVTDYVSIGDYVLTGGELAAMVMIDAVARLVPGVLGNDASPEEESFFNDLLEYPQYSRPEVWHGRAVPEVLLSGDHRAVAAWRLEQSERRTAALRPDLYARHQERQRLIQYLSMDKRNNIHMMEGLARGQYEILQGAASRRTAPCGEVSCGTAVSCETAPCGSGLSGAFPVRGRRGAYRDIDVLLYDSRYRIGMAAAQDPLSGGRLAGLLPEDAQLLVVSQPFLRDILTERGFRVADECIQVLYTRREPLPVRHKDIRRLGMEHLPYLRAHYRLTAGGDGAPESRSPASADSPGKGSGEEAYLRERLRSGALYGAFSGEELLGFIGMHTDGRLGMLYVEEPRRRQGIGKSLEAYAVNRMLERGWTPYGHVRAGNAASERLQEKLGFYRAEKTFWRLEKGLANGTGMC